MPQSGHYLGHLNTRQWKAQEGETEAGPRFDLKLHERLLRTFIGAAFIHLVLTRLRGSRKQQPLCFPKPLLRKGLIKWWCYYSRSSRLRTQPAAISQASATGRDFPLPSCVIIVATKPKSFDKENQLRAVGLGDNICPAERETITSSPLYFSKRRIN